MLKFWRSFFVAISMLLSFSIFAAGSQDTPKAPDLSRIQNFKELSQNLGFQNFYSSKKSVVRPIKIAIFDNGFDGYKDYLGISLPSDTAYIAGDSKDTTVPDPESAVHGTAMAQIVNAFMTNSNSRPDLAPKLFLFQVTGYNNLKTAIDQATTTYGVDIIVQSMVREYGSNYDGKGFFNAEVNRALKAGVLWINAAGNFGKTTYNLRGMPTKDDYIELPGPKQSIPIRCSPVVGKSTCNLRLVLSWNDFKDDVNQGTDKDLDLYLTDETSTFSFSAGLIQDKVEHRLQGADGQNTPDPRYSLYPREILERELKPGRYFIRVKNQSKNFVATDSLRLSTDSPFITFENYDVNESLNNPADNSGVITVGANDINYSAKSVKLNKPELSVASRIQLSKDVAYEGSSNSAAIVAAAAGLILSQESVNKSREDLILTLQKAFISRPRGHGLPLLALSFWPASGNCFQSVTLQGVQPGYIQNVLARGGVLVQTTVGLRIMTKFDPLNLALGRQRNQPDDIVATTPNGFAILPRSEISNMPNNWAEVFEWPRDANLCQDNN